MSEAFRKGGRPVFLFIAIIVVLELLCLVVQRIIVSPPICLILRGLRLLLVLGYVVCENVRVIDHLLIRPKQHHGESVWP